MSAQSINGRKRDNVQVSVTVTVKEPGVDLVLNAPPRPGVGGRAPSSRERQIFEMWDGCHLNDGDINVGALNSFIKQLQRFL